MKICPLCHGSAVVGRFVPSPWGYVKALKDCPYCDGKGTIEEVVLQSAGQTETIGAIDTSYADYDPEYQGA